MTQRTIFTCDRCRAEDYSNEQDFVTGPIGWTDLRMNRHSYNLCVKCSGIVLTALVKIIEEDDEPIVRD